MKDEKQCFQKTACSLDLLYNIPRSTQLRGSEQ